MTRSEAAKIERGLKLTKKGDSIAAKLTLVVEDEASGYADGELNEHVVRRSLAERLRRIAAYLEA